jgi:predicted  nucleic acid-binding Zn-ribbon protein
LNTLKFAQRAKTIKNKARLNIQKSVEAYIKIIEELKLQLSQANGEIEKLKTMQNTNRPMDRDTKRCLTFMPSQLSEELVIFNHQYPEQKSISVNDLEMDESTEISRLKEEIIALKQENTDLETQVSELKGCLTKESLTKKGFSSIVEQFANNQKEKCRLTDSEVLREENKSLKVQASILKSHIEKLNAKFTMLLKKLRKGEKNSEWEFNETKLNIDNLTPRTLFTNRRKRT